MTTETTALERELEAQIAQNEKEIARCLERAKLLKKETRHIVRTKEKLFGSKNGDLFSRSA
jgi:hypothetical protein